MSYGLRFKQIFRFVLLIDVIVLAGGLLVMVPQILNGQMSWETPLFFVGVMLFASLISWLVMRPMLRDQTILETGEEAWGKLLKYWDTGTTINDNPLVGMQLEVHRKDGSFYQAKTSTVIPRLEIGDLREGAQVLLKVNRSNPQKVAFAGFQEGQEPVEAFSSPAETEPSAGELARAKLEELDELHARGWIAEDLYQIRRAEILHLRAGN